MKSHRLGGLKSLDLTASFKRVITYLSKMWFQKYVRWDIFCRSPFSRVSSHDHARGNSGNFRVSKMRAWLEWCLYRKTTFILYTPPFHNSIDIELDTYIPQSYKSMQCNAILFSLAFGSVLNRRESFLSYRTRHFDFPHSRHEFISFVNSVNIILCLRKPARQQFFILLFQFLCFLL